MNGGRTLLAIGNNSSGMAGSFGFEAKKYDLSLKIAEHGLLAGAAVGIALAGVLRGR